MGGDGQPLKYTADFFIFVLTKWCFGIIIVLKINERRIIVNWKKFLGESLYGRMVKYTKERKITVACFIRMAVEKFVKEEV